MDFNTFNFDLKQLRSFNEICKERSFTKASRNLKINQSTISHHINQLEKNLGVDLITRSSKEFSITLEGQHLLKFCDSLFNNIDILFDDMSQNISGGHEHIAASTIPAVYIVPKIIASLRKKNPEFIYRVSSQDSRNVIEEIKDGSINIGIVGKKLSHPSLKYKKIFSDSITLIGPPRSKASIKSEELKELPLIIREKGSGTGDYLRSSLEEKNILLSQCSIVHHASSTEAMINGVAEGAGYAFVSSLALTHKAPKISQITIEDLTLKRDFYIVHLEKKRFSQGEKLFIEELENITKAL